LERYKSLLELLLAAGISCGIVTQPGNHPQLVDVGQGLITGPRHDVESIHPAELNVLLLRVPPEAFVVKRGLHEIPFAGTAAEVVQVDENWVARPVEDDVSDIGITMDWPTGKSELQGCEPRLSLRDPRLKESTLLLGEYGVNIAHPAYDSVKHRDVRKLERWRRLQLVQAPEEISYVCERSVVFRIRD
jgi:hypothetical protein